MGKENDRPNYGNFVTMKRFSFTEEEEQVFKKIIKAIFNELEKIVEKTIKEYLDSEEGQAILKKCDEEDDRETKEKADKR